MSLCHWVALVAVIIVLGQNGRRIAEWAVDTVGWFKGLGK